MWLALPLTAFQYLSVWDLLPGRMASHFNAQWQPNGWMSRGTSLWFALGLIAFLLTVFAAITYATKVTHAPEKFSWAFLGFSYLIIAFVCVIDEKVIQYNLTGASTNPGSFLLIIPIGIVILIAIYLSNRGTALRAAPVIATEVHRSTLFSGILLLPVAGVCGAFVTVPDSSLRVAVSIVAAMLGLCAFAAWDGFHYVFTQRGLEIRTLGFRLRSIPVEQIRSFASAPWSPLRGYGIRGIGNSQAYVWGNRGVRVETAQGRVFLGHHDPQRILHDLSAIKQFAQ